ncbi:MAG: prenyltransferase/squalene oxidase repeat-containing protein [Planctomycetales bacterium]
MSSGWLEHRRFRIDGPHPPASGREPIPPRTGALEPLVGQSPRLQGAIERTRDWLLDQQSPEGYWVGELEGDTILESEYILLLAYLGQERSAVARRCANYILDHQLPDGGWAIYPGGPLEISASVKAYWALKITGHSPESEPLVRARQAIRAAGGAERVNSFTRYYLALLGVISYDQCPAVPPEIVLLPSWCPFNIHEMSAWSRTILVPLSLLWAYRPRHELAPEHDIPELFLDSPAALPMSMGPSEVVDPLSRPARIDWNRFFNRIDRAWKFCERWRLTPLRGLAIRRAADWMTQRFEASDGLGAIFPPIIWSVVALKCLGHAEDSPLVQGALRELEKLSIREGESVRLQPCKSPVWDTAIATIALRDAGVPATAEPLRKAIDWLLSKEVRAPGDWTVRSRNKQPGGWYFEFENQFYPDVDDTVMVLIALSRCLPEGDDGAWRTTFLVEDLAGAESDGGGVVVSRRGGAGSEALQELEAARPLVEAMSRGARWVAGMQNRDGGWGAFDRDNDRELFTRVPFADHNAMIDPSTADLTARALEAFAALGMPSDHSIVRRALDFVWQRQEPDHCWFGRWGVNYLYGTWQTLVGLTAIGVPASDARLRRAVAWLKRHQHDCGGWGETPRSYDDPSLRGQGPPTPSQTAWALLGLCAAGEAHSAAAEAGVQYLLDTQNEDGTWDEEPFTGTGFPKVFYLRYQLYRIYFPLMALARVSRLRGEGPGRIESGEWTVENAE